MNLSRCFFGMYRKICSRVSSRRGAWRFGFSFVTLIFMVCAFLLQVVITYFASGNCDLAGFRQRFCDRQAVCDVTACFAIDDRRGQSCCCESPAYFSVYDDSKYYPVCHSLAPFRPGIAPRPRCYIRSCSRKNIRRCRSGFRASQRWFCACRIWWSRKGRCNRL